MTVTRTWLLIVVLFLRPSLF